MGLFDNMRMAQDMMKNMSPDQIQQLMKQAQDSKVQMDQMIREAVEQEIKKRNLVSRDEVEEMIRKVRSE